MNRVPIFIPRVFNPNIECSYGYIYITTNLVNNMKYIGQHRLHARDKQYLGSGTILKKSIDKYGKENFISEPIDWAGSFDELNEKESWWIDFLEAVESNQYYNLIEGGNLGIGSLNVSGENNPMYGVHMFGKDNPFYGKSHTKETKRNASVRMSGKNNPMYGVTSPMKGRFGKYNPQSIKIVQLTKDNKFIKIFDSISDAEREVHGLSGEVNCGSICSCCKGLNKSHKGFKWMYQSDYLKLDENRRQLS